MALLDTGLENELLILDTGLENSAMAAENSDVQTFWVITSRAKGGANNPFGGSANSNQTSQLVQMTEQDLYQEYQDSGQLQDLFGSWDNYKGYVIESQEFIQTADWMTVTPEYETGSKEWAFLNGEDLAWRPGEREKIQEKIIADRVMARTAAFNEWIGGEQGQALMQKYGIQPIIYNNDGDEFKWTGSGYQKTIKVDDHAGFADYVKAVLTSVVTYAVTAGVASVAGAALQGTAVGDAIGKAANTVKEFLGEALAAVPGISPQNANTIAEFFFPTVPGKGGLGGQADPFGLLGGLTGSAAGGQAGYEEIANAVNNAMSGNVIINLAGTDFNNQGGYTESEDGTYTITNPDKLPPGYIVDVLGRIIHAESGTVVYEGNIYEELYPVKGMGANFITFEPYKPGEDGGGNTGSTDGATSGGSPMSQAEANAKIQELIDKGLVGQELYEAIIEAGVTPNQAIQAIYDGVYTGDALLSGDNTPSTTGGESGKPELVLYDGNPNLLDENGVWVGGGTFFDRTDPENPRKYYVWTNKETGESIRVYDDELDIYDGGVKDFEAYLKDELPDITEDELILARKLLELGDPVGQVIADIIAGRKDLNENNTNTVTLPDGSTVEVPATDSVRKEGDPCSIGDKYNGTVIVAPSGQLVCKIEFGSSEDAIDNDGDPDATPDAVPKDGDPCPLPNGAGEGVIKDGECQPRTNVTSVAILPSLVCDSGWADSTGACIPADDPRIAGVNTPVPGQCPPGYSKNRRGECIPNTKGDMGGDSEGDNDNGSIPNDGEPCEVDGKKGTYQDGVCVISTNTFYPGVIDLTGDSEWGDGGDGGGDNGGDGPGDGPGDGDDGNGGPGLGDVAARKGSSNPVWSPIPPGYQFRRFQKRQGIGANAPMLSQSLFQAPDLSSMRKGLLTSMQNDLKKV